MHLIRSCDKDLSLQLENIISRMIVDEVTIIGYIWIYLFFFFLYYNI